MNVTFDVGETSCPIDIVWFTRLLPSNAAPFSDKVTPVPALNYNGLETDIENISFVSSELIATPPLGTCFIK